MLTREDKAFSFVQIAALARFLSAATIYIYVVHLGGTLDACAKGVPSHTVKVPGLIRTENVLGGPEPYV